MTVNEENNKVAQRISSDRYPMTRILDEGFLDPETRTVPNWLIVVGLIAGVVISCGLILPFYAFAAIFYFGIRGAFSIIPGFADDVDDGGDHLIVRQKGVSRRIEISQIEEVTYRGYNNPPRIRLRLRTGTLGRQNHPSASVVTFIPDLSQGRDAARGLADDLQRRADAT